jgi:membrane associated rhomboid family serine protease
MYGSFMAVSWFFANYSYRLGLTKRLKERHTEIVVSVMLRDNQKAALIVWFGFALGSALSMFVLHSDPAVAFGVAVGGVTFGILLWFGSKPKSRSDQH